MSGRKNITEGPKIRFKKIPKIFQKPIDKVV